MKICRYCEKEIADQDKICSNCGYNPQTDTLTASFVKKTVKPGSGRKQTAVSSGIKTFAFWGIAIVICSLAIKYQGKIGDVFWKAKDLIPGNKAARNVQVPQKTKPTVATRLMDVRSYEASVPKSSGKNKKIEGIFYDPQGKNYVVISGRLVSENESFEDMVIKKINSDSVEVLEAGQVKTLKVNK